MLNLGEQLKQLKIKIQNKETERQLREAEAARVKVAKEKAEIAYKFEKAWGEMVCSLSEENLPNGIKVESYDTPLKGYKSGFGVITPESPQHPHHDVYQEWNKKAAENGLVLKIHQEHDGGGMRGWLRIIYVAKE